ncbi:MAG TPA: selenocysteine-specific translation elongation factor [Solirubrobacterales bacterium]|nr:selenocysteine-specific translation elongation factor [Solirubrobacterales bacterium]
MPQPPSGRPWPEVAPRPLTVGTAGHIDHGKTALVRALTGRDTDRLAEEQRRGMSIELGFASLDLGDRRLSLIDVPGHERFVRTMIAGASGIDMFLLIVAADDGPMPQTHEHLAVLQALGVEHGVIALTKVDLMGEETRALAAEDAAELVPGAPLIEVSSETGEGLDDLRAALARVAAEASQDRRSSLGRISRYKDERRGVVDAPVLHVDRAFTVAGHGTVVTGTLWSGRLERGQRVTVLPSDREARVRSIEVHDQALEVADAHQRVALNLGGIERDEVQRGDVIATDPAGVEVTYRLDVDLSTSGGPGTDGGGIEAILAEPRVQVHLGTRDSPARVVDLGDGGAQMRLERPLLARAGDRVVIRRIAPPDTLGGGIVRDPSPPRHGPGWEPTAPEEQSTPTPPPTPTDPGPLARKVVTELEKDGPRPRGAAQLAEDLGAERREVEKAFGELATAGAAVRAKADVVYAATAYEMLARLTVALAERDGATTIASVRDALGLSRKYAQALLEQLDAEKRLRRDGDRHLPRAGTGTQ